MKHDISKKYLILGFPTVLSLDYIPFLLWRHGVLTKKVAAVQLHTLTHTNTPIMIYTQAPGSEWYTNGACKEVH
jgi:hypothetical protein